MKSLIIRDGNEKVIAIITKVTSCNTNDRLVGEKTLSFETLMADGLESMQSDQKYIVEFENDYYDVVSFQKKMTGNLCFISLDCEHVSYRLNDTEIEYFSRTGTAKEILVELMQGTGFIVSTAPNATLTYSRQQSATVRAVLLDFATLNGWDVVFDKYGSSHFCVGFK